MNRHDADVPRVVTVHLDEGYRTGLVVAEGPKFMSFITPDAGGISIMRLPWVDYIPKTRIEVKLKVIERPEYPVPAAKKRLRMMGRKVGVTKAAKKALMG